MADDPKKRGGLERKLVSQQPHELAHLQKKHGLSRSLASEVVKKAGPSRKAVEAAIAKKPTAGAAKKAPAKRPTPKK